MVQVAITGLGLFVPGYNQPELLFNDLCLGKSLLRKEKLGPNDNSISVVASSVSDDEFLTLETLYPVLSHPDISKATKMALFAAHQAVNNANLDTFQLQQRLGLFVGVNKNLINPAFLPALWGASKDTALSTKQHHQITAELKTLRVTQATEIIAKELGIYGIAMTHSDACTAGASAIVSAQRRIINGELDVAICGASEHASHPLMQMHFHKLGASCQTSFSEPTMYSRPFDKNRSGCILGDGSAFLILESVVHAKKRGVTPIAYLQGVSRQSEAYKPTSTKPDGSLYMQCINKALNNANIKPECIDHINAHGTSTVSNDQAESLAIDKLFPHRPSVTSTKSSLGHLLAASGTIEAVLSVLSLQKQHVLPTLNYSESKPDEPKLNIITKSQPQCINYLMSNSFGFGGENSSLIFSKTADCVC